MTPAQAVIAKHMSERQLQDNVIELAQSVGYFVFHTHDSRHSEAGFPDLVIVGHGRLLLAELKRSGLAVDTAQLYWITELQIAANASGGVVEIHVWRPENWLSGEIEAVLR